MWNSRGGWKKNKKLIVGREGGERGEVVEKTENFNSRGMGSVGS